jgi:hypothetical protein
MIFHFFEITFIKRPDILQKLKAIHENNEVVSLLKPLSPFPFEERKSVILFDDAQKLHKSPLK